ncbi:hypothetical protein BDY24DRAFT_147288 [Mrakia frigida]|uniref:nucleotidyltransferase domain-containing protein n=1 Tax=Mrakia frigida TaxID=29902 RepID=UPI003FCC1B1D
MSQECIPGSAFPTWRSILNGVDLRSKLPDHSINSAYSGRDYILQNYKNSKPSDDTLLKRAQSLEALEKCIQNRYGSHFHVNLFGSTAYGLDTNITDLDICIVDASNLKGGKHSSYSYYSSTPSPYNINNLANCLREGGFQVTKVIADANTPIIKAYLPSNSIPLDINVNCLSGTHNTTFLYHHGRLSRIFLPLAFFIKTWSKDRSLSSSDRRSNVTSYTLVLLLLIYLVQIGAVEDLLARKYGDGYGWVDQDLKIDPGARQGGASCQIWRQRYSTGRADGVSEVREVDMVEALRGFFGFLEAWEPTVSREMMSLRLGGKARRTKPGSKTYMVVEDPFVTDRVS